MDYRHNMNPISSSSAIISSTAELMEVLAKGLEQHVAILSDIKNCPSSLVIQAFTAMCQLYLCNKFEAFHECNDSIFQIKEIEIITTPFSHVFQTIPVEFQKHNLNIRKTAMIF